MIIRMIVTGLVALSLSSVPLSYSADRTPTPQTTRTAPASIQRPQSTHLPNALRIFVQEDLSTPESWRRELAYWANKVGVATFFVEKDGPYDFADIIGLRRRKRLWLMQSGIRRRLIIVQRLSKDTLCQRGSVVAGR
jgi:hypothetical protein